MAGTDTNFMMNSKDRLPTKRITLEQLTRRCANETYAEQYRYVFGRNTVEIPAGKLEPGEDPFDAIQRELQEEIGATALVAESPMR